ncbi:MAG: response regulator [Vogesella sp.]|uniref:response regulator n=1 Tax=Vogesella sp. TaxID=1904252 RepID=UPI003F3DD81B
MKHIILVVDDSPVLRQISCEALSDAGYKVLQAENGKAGLLQLDKHTPSLIISDLNMPEMNGLEFIRTLRQRPALVQVPVIMVTTELSDNMKAAGRAAGATAWLTKPLQPPLLLKAVNALLRQ